MRSLLCLYYISSFSIRKIVNLHNPVCKNCMADFNLHNFKYHFLLFIRQKDGDQNYI